MHLFLFTIDQAIFFFFIFNYEEKRIYFMQIAKVKDFSQALIQDY